MRTRHDFTVGAALCGRPSAFARHPRCGRPRRAAPTSETPARSQTSLPQRRQNRLNGYDYSQNGAYFVTVCVQNKVHLFGDIVGAALRGRPNFPDKMIKKWIMEIENKFAHVKIQHFVIMPNHIHLILFIESQNGMGSVNDGRSASVSQIMDWFKTMTTNEYISGVKQEMFLPFQKRLWQRSYHDHIIRNENDYRQLAEYIENNPAQWQDDCLRLPSN